MVQGQWSIAAKELTPIVMATALWGNLWRGKIVLVHCDDQAVVEVVNAGYSKDPLLMQLLRCLFFIMAYFEITVRANHIPGKSNGAVDAISRNDFPRFFSQVPSANQQATIIPPALMELVIFQQPDWLSPTWGQLFKNFLQQALQPLPERFIHPEPGVTYHSAEPSTGSHSQ